MGDNHSFLALDWVKGEIEETLKQARQALEAHVENADDPTHLRFCLAYLHQVFGTLQMVEFYGAALLAEEMEKLALALINNTVPHVAEGHELLMRGILQLPPYLERVKASRRDLPVVLLPLLNDLRAVRGESLLSETALFTPDMAAAESAPAPERPAKLDNRTLKKLRNGFQVSLLGFIRQEKVEENLQHLAQVLGRLEQTAGATPHRELWQVAAAVVEGLQHKAIDAGTSIKMLLGQVDRQLRHLGESDEPLPADLIKNLLYYVAKSTGQSPQMRAIKDRYRLDEALPGDSLIAAERTRMAGPDRDAIRSVVDALCEELNRVKEVLDLFVRNQSGNVKELSALVPILKQVADTIAVLGLGQPRRIVQEQIESIDRITAAGLVPQDGSLLDIAGALLYVEATLNGMVSEKPIGTTAAAAEDENEFSGQKQLSEAQAAVLRESRSALERSKDAVIEFIASQWNPVHLEAIPELLHNVRGGLTILEMAHAADILARAGSYISERLLKEQYRPDWPEMDTLADIITSVEYYLERVANDSQGSEAVLDIAETGLGKLGYLRAEPVPADLVQDSYATLAGFTVPDFSLADVKKPADAVQDFDATVVNADTPEQTMVAPASVAPAQPAANVPSLDALRARMEQIDTSSDPLSFGDEMTLADFSMDDVSAPPVEQPAVAVADEPVIAAPAELPAVVEPASDTRDLSEDPDKTVLRFPEAAPVPAEEVLPAAVSASLPEVPAAVSASVPEVSAVVSSNAPEVRAAVERAAPAAAGPVDDFSFDEEICEIFVEEAQEVLDTINDYFPTWAANFEERDALVEFRRGFHTLKGSGRMVGAKSVGELAWSIENLLNKVRDKAIEPSGEIVDVITQALAILPSLVEDFAARRPPRADILGLMAAASALGRGEADHEVPHADVPLSMPSAEAVLRQQLAATAATPHEPARVVLVAMQPDDFGFDEEIREIFVEEAAEVLESINHDFPVWAADFHQRDALIEFRRGFHTLKGSGRMVGAKTVGELAWAVENMLNKVRDKIVEPQQPMVNLISEVLAILPELIEDFAARQTPRYNTSALMGAADIIGRGESFSAVDVAKAADYAHNPVEEYAASAADFDALAASLAPSTAASPTDDVVVGEVPDEAYALASSAAIDDTGDTGLAELDADAQPSTADADPVLLEIFTTEADAHLVEIQNYLHESANSRSAVVTDEVLRSLHTLKGSAGMAGIAAVSDVAAPMEHLYKDMRNQGGVVNREQLDALQGVHDFIRLCIQDLLAGGSGDAGDRSTLIAHIKQLDQERLSLLERSGSTVGDGLTDTAWGEAVTAATVGRVASFMALGLDHLLDAPWELDGWLQGSDADNMIRTLRQELMKLSPAAKRAGIHPLATLTERLDAVYGRIAEQTLDLDSSLLTDLSAAHDEIINVFDTLAASQTVAANERLLDQLQDWIEYIPTASDISDEPAAASFEVTPPAAPAPVVATVAPAAPVAESGIDPELLEIFLEEAEEVLEEVDREFTLWVHDESNKPALAALQRHLHTLKGGARLAQIKPLGDFAHELESLYEDLRDARVSFSKALTDLLQQCHDAIADMVAELKRSSVCEPATTLLAKVIAFRQGCAPVADDDLADVSGDSQVLPLTTEAGYRHFDQPLEGVSLEQLREAQAESEPEPEPEPEPVVVPVPLAAEPEFEELGADVDPELLEIFLEEAGEIVDTTSELLGKWGHDPANLQPVRELQRGLHTLKGGARMAGIVTLGNLAHQMEDLYEGLCSGVFVSSPSLLQLLQRCHDRLAVAVECLQQGKGCPSMADLAVSLTQFIAHPLTYEDIIHAAPKVDPHRAPETTAGAVVAPVAPVTPAAPVRPVEPVAESASDVDADILEIFFEESDELAESIEASIAEWLDDRENRQPMEALLRHLHTLKGGARLAGLTELGNLAHDFETDLVSVQQRLKKPDEALFNSLSGRADQIMAVLREVRARAEVGSAPPAPVAEVAASVLAPQPVAEIIPLAAGEQRYSHSALADDAQRAAPPPMSGSFRNLQGNRGPQEMIRVPSELLEKLVNLAGETSITRSRVEMGVHGFAQTVEEMGVTIQRLADQLRRMDAEMETQIISRHNEERDGKYEDFDPLEMDQYSSLNQLSKALSESASDLLDLKATLIDKARDAETLLLQQSRINTELQEGLMRSRMVPFSRLVPRLKRIVRQTAQELGKSADLDVINPEGEMDRTLLERVVVPLEHMLRNAVDHGIESKVRRTESGKAEEGKVTLTLTREGGEVVLTLVDDGAGINVDAVRRKAIERGLISSTSDMSDEEAIQFIFHAGFSTAEKVTQISGRGVGMDVVQSEIKQMGGVVTIASKPGQGTTFIIRLPFTVAVSRALMVRVGGDVYAVPLAQIEGIVRASPYELETYYAPGAPMFDYAGVSYRLSYLGEFVHGVHSPNLVGHVLPLPVLLVRGAGDQRIAIQVDQLIGSREIVVKSVGLQLSSVAGISGATILGDGSVVIILDVVAMLRAAAISRPAAALPGAEVAAAVPASAAPQPEVPSTRTVMVVDDSVTVRKVTSRLLERHGYEVVLAKDGLDAIAKLEEQRPDVMLLDIEMPRMDGFEVASLVRHNPKLEDLPIIMITSRTGEKHRERAFQIGVNCYMGKPFQEQQLLETIAELLESVVGQ